MASGMDWAAQYSRVISGADTAPNSSNPTSGFFVISAKYGNETALGLMAGSLTNAITFNLWVYDPSSSRWLKLQNALVTAVDSLALVHSYLAPGMKVFAECTAGTGTLILTYLPVGRLASGALSALEVLLFHVTNSPITED